jgi:hypothetical protein
MLPIRCQGTTGGQVKNETGADQGHIDSLFSNLKAPCAAQLYRNYRRRVGAIMPGIHYILQKDRRNYQSINIDVSVPLLVTAIVMLFSISLFFA